MASTIQAIATKDNSPQHVVLAISEFFGKAYLLVVDSATGDLSRAPIAVPMPALGAGSEMENLRSALLFAGSERILVAFAHDNHTFSTQITLQ